MRVPFLLLLAGLLAWPVLGDDLQRAQELAWGKRFAESEALYRRILEREPRSEAARLGLARVVMWQGRYREALSLFAPLSGIEAEEGRATALYWSGDLRGAARRFRRVLALDPNREFARTSLREIASTAVPSQRVSVERAEDDQPLDALRSEIATTFFSDPQTRWTATLGGYDANDRRGEYVSVANETTFRGFAGGASLGLFTWPDGVRRPIGSASVRWRQFRASVERRPELATVTSLRTHAASTITALRWDYNRRHLIAAAEASHRAYFDGNAGRGAYAYAIVPLRRKEWTLWSGASLSTRDTDETRFTDAGVYDPYWTPHELVEGRIVMALERPFVKIHADGGTARDRGITYRPWRAGIGTSFEVARGYRFEAGIERSSTLDYRATSFHAALVRRR